MGFSYFASKVVLDIYSFLETDLYFFWASMAIGHDYITIQNIFIFLLTCLPFAKVVMHGTVLIMLKPLLHIHT